VLVDEERKMPATSALIRRNIRTRRHLNAPAFISVADDLDQVLRLYALRQINNLGSVSWKLPSNHEQAGVAAAELTYEGDGRHSFGLNEELIFRSSEVASSGIFRTAFRVLPLRHGTASFVDVRLVLDKTHRHDSLRKLCEFMGLVKQNDGGDDDQFLAALRNL
jgi:hypothetical protein